MAEVADVSERRVCQVLAVSRSVARDREEKGRRRRLAIDEVLAARIQRLIADFPRFCHRRLWAILRYRDGVVVNRKAVYRVLARKGWFVHQRQVTPRPRVQAKRSRAERSDQRWALDVSHVDCGADGWGHLAAVIDCHDREIVGWEFSLRARAKEAERALESACIARFGTLRPDVVQPP